MEIAINRCFGGFGLSVEAVEMWAKLEGIEQVYWFDYNYNLIEDRKRLKEMISAIPYSTNDLSKIKSKQEKNYSLYHYVRPVDFNRNHPNLIKVLKALGDKANGLGAKITIVDVPDDVEWEINDYDGMESVEEVHRSWC